MLPSSVSTCGCKLCFLIECHTISCVFLSVDDLKCNKNVAFLDPSSVSPVLQSDMLKNALILNFCRYKLQILEVQVTLTKSLPKELIQ